MSNELIEVRPFLVMDKEDEKQILAEMKGEIIKSYVYSYDDKKGKKVEGLSMAGINAMSIHMAETGHPIRVLDQWITEDDRYYKAIVKVGRFSIKEDGTEILLDTGLGTKRQSKEFKPGVDNPFAFELAVSKAERNARKKLMPEKIIIEMMKVYKKQPHRIKKLENANDEAPTQEELKPQPTKSKYPTAGQKKLINGLRKQLNLEAKSEFPSITTNQAVQKEVKDLQETITVIAEINDYVNQGINWNETQEREFLDTYGISNWQELKYQKPDSLKKINIAIHQYKLKNEIEGGGNK